MLLNEVSNRVMKGWGSHITPEIKKFHTLGAMLTMEDGCLLYGSRVIVPKALQESIIILLHANHAGMLKMKQLARRFVFWFGMDKDIELCVQSCEPCQLMTKDKPNKEYGEWPEPRFPFDRVHGDFFHFHDHSFFILIDAYSRWLEVKMMTKTDAVNVIRELESFYSMFGYPTTFVCDNGPPFGSFGLKKHFETKGIELKHSPPYHPQSNGIVERAVQTTKNVLKKFVLEHGFSKLQIAEDIKKFLRIHRNSPTTENELVPAYKIFNFVPRTELTSLRVNFEEELTLNKKIEFKKDKPKLSFKEGEEVVYICRAQNQLFRYKATIVKKRSNFTYDIKVNGITKMAHVNQLNKSILKHCHLPSQTSIPNSVGTPKTKTSSSPSAGSNIKSPLSMRTRSKVLEDKEIVSPTKSNILQKSEESGLNQTPSGRPKRMVRPPERYSSL